MINNSIYYTTIIILNKKLRIIENDVGVEEITNLYQQTALMILLMMMFIVQLGVGLIIPVLPKFIQEFGVSGATLGYLVSAMGLTQFLFSPLAGEWADRYGRKKIILWGIGMFSLSQFLFGVAQDLWLLYLSRLIAGMGIAFTTPGIMAYVADVTTEETRGKGLAWVGAAMSFGIVIGPGLGGFLAEYGTRIPFYMAAIVSALGMLGALLMLPESLSLEKQAEYRQFQKKQTHIFAQIFLSFKSSYLLLLLVIFILTFALVSVEVVFALYMDVKYGFTPQDIAILFTSGALFGVLIQAFVTDWLLRRFGEGRVITVSLLLTASTLLLLLCSGTFWYILVVTTLFISFTAILRPALNTLLSKMAGQEQGFIAGMNNAYTSLGIIIGPAIAGILFDIHIDLPYLFGGMLILVSLGIHIWQNKSTREIT